MTAVPLLTPGLVADILAHARADDPRECCGLIVRGTHTPVRAVRCRNLSPRPEAAFELDTSDLPGRLAGDEEPIAAYHSHPDGPSGPSPGDAAYDGHLPVLIAVLRPTPSVVAWWVP